MLTKVLALVLVVLIGLALGIETARYVHAHATGVDVSGVVNIHHALGFGLLATSGALLLSLSREWLRRQWTRFSVWLELTLDGLLDFNSLNVGDGLGSVGVSTSSALSESVRGRCLMKLYDLRFGAGSAGELRREMDALHRHPDGSLNWQASNAAIIASMEQRLAGVPSASTPEYEAAHKMRSTMHAYENTDQPSQVAGPAMSAKTTCSGCGKRGHWSPDCPTVRPSSRTDGSYVIEVGPNETPEDVARRHPDLLLIEGDVLIKRPGVSVVIVRRKEQ